MIGLARLVVLLQPTPEPTDSYLSEDAQVFTAEDGARFEQED